MKVFKDSKKQLNLHPLVVYFLQTSKEKRVTCITTCERTLKA